MGFKYFHDEALEIVYRIPTQPQIYEKFDKHRRTIITWTVSMEIEITRSDNVLMGNNTWKYAVSDYPEQHFENIGNRYDEERVISYFYRNHAPKALEIDKDTYTALRKNYENKARKNKNI